MKHRDVTLVARKEISQVGVICIQRLVEVGPIGWENILVGFHEADENRFIDDRRVLRIDRPTRRHRQCHDASFDFLTGEALADGQVQIPMRYGNQE